MPVSRTFIVRLSTDSPGGPSGTVESVRTGEKLRFRGTDGIGPVIEAMLTSAPPNRRPSIGGGVA